MSWRIPVREYLSFDYDDEECPEYEDLSESQPPTPEPTQASGSRKRSILWTQCAPPPKRLRLEDAEADPMSEAEIRYAEEFVREVEKFQTQAARTRLKELIVSKMARLQITDRNAADDSDSSTHFSSQGGQSWASWASSQASGKSVEESGRSQASARSQEDSGRSREESTSSQEQEESGEGQEEQEVSQEMSGPPRKKMRH